MVGKYSYAFASDILECRDKEGTYMRSISRVLPAALGVMVLALTLGLASSLWTSSGAEAANDPAPVAAPSMVDADSCTTYVYGGYNGLYGGGIYGYPFYSGYQAPVVTFPCVSPAFCVGTSYNPYYYTQAFLVCPGPPAALEMPATNAATCASATNFTVKVRDANGLNVLDGTSVSFSVAPFGMITGAVDTNGGEATASLTTPTKTSGPLTVTVTAGSVTQTASVNVSCSAPGSVSYGGSSTSTQPAAVIYATPGGGGYGGY
jgi:hypothetical protein